MCSGELIEAAGYGKNGQQMSEHEEKLGKEAMRLRPEKGEAPFPRRAHFSPYQDSLARGKAEERGQDFWDAEQLDPDQTHGWRTCIASQSLCPREAVMSSLRTREQGCTRG
jgi:hypothetical protein